MKYIAIILIFFIVAASGCYYDNKNLLIQPAPCDSTAIATYSGSVQPILASVCYGCHSGSAPAGSIKLDQYGPVRNIAVGTNSLLLGVINHGTGYDAMPKSGGKLNDCDIMKITKWIAAGALNN